MKLGIDYGTTTTLISYTTSERHRSKSLLINIGGNRTGYVRSSIPSIIAINKDKGFAIGYEAEKIAASGPPEVIMLRSLKRCLSCDIKEGDREKCLLESYEPTFMPRKPKTKLIQQDQDSSRTYQRVY